MKNERKTAKNVTKKTTSREKPKKDEKSKDKNIIEDKSKLRPAEFPEAIVELILNKIISYVVRQTAVKEVYTHMSKKCFSYLKYLINPYLSTEFINYENGLDNTELNKNKINYKTVVTEKVNTWTFFSEPETPGIDRYSSGAAKLINLKIESNELKEEHKNLVKRQTTLIDTNLILNESIEYIKHEKKASQKKIIKKRIKRKKSEEKEKSKEKEQRTIEEKIIELPHEDLPKEKYENEYMIINDNEENNELRKEREYILKKKMELKAIQDLQDKKDKLKRFQNKLQKKFDGSKQTFDPEGKIISIHSPPIDNFNNEFNFVKIPNILNKQKKERTSSIVKLSKNIQRLSRIDIQTKNKNWDKLPPDIKEIFNYIKDTLIPKWQKKPLMKISQGKKESKRKYNANKSFKAFFGPFLKRYVLKGNVIHNPADILKNNVGYVRHDKSKKDLLNPSGSNFNIIKPEIGVVIEEKNKKKKEMKDGGFEYIKKYNKPSMYEFSRLVMESSNLNSLNSRALSSGLIESKVNEINEIKNINKFQELNKDDYNGYIFEFSDNVNPLFQNALSLNDKQSNIEDKKNEKEVDNYKDKNIFRAMEEGYLKSKYNSMNTIDTQKSIQLSDNINNLYKYFEDNDSINKNEDKKNTIEVQKMPKIYSAVRNKRRNNDIIINKAPLPKIRINRANINKSEMREMKNKIKGRKIINRFNYGILKDKRWGEDDQNAKKKHFGFEKQNSLKSKDDYNLLKKAGENIMTNGDNIRIKRGLFKSASVGNIF